MLFQNQNIGLVSPGGEIRAFFNAGVLYEMLKNNINYNKDRRNIRRNNMCSTSITI